MKLFDGLEKLIGGFLATFLSHKLITKPRIATYKCNNKRKRFKYWNVKA